MSYWLGLIGIHFYSEVIEAVENDSDQCETVKSKHIDETAIKVYNVGNVRIQGQFEAAMV